MLPKSLRLVKVLLKEINVVGMLGSGQLPASVLLGFLGVIFFQPQHFL